MKYQTVVGLIRLAMVIAGSVLIAQFTDWKAGLAVMLLILVLTGN